MSTLARVQTNRRNAKRSTGPRSAAGKAKSSRNALKHGLQSLYLLLPYEPEEELAAFVERLRRDLCPVGELEELLFGRIATAAWRLRRAMLFDQEIASLPDVEATSFRDGSRSVKYHDRVRRFDHLCRYETTIERFLYKALHELQRLQTARRGGRVAPPVALDVDVAVSRADLTDTTSGFVSQNGGAGPTSPPIKRV